MARETFKYQPLDLEPDIGIGISLPFNRAVGGRSATQAYNTNIGGGSIFNTTYTTLDQATSNLKNLLLTRRGERLYLPTFGSPIPDYLFENINPSVIDDIENDIRETINFWLPYIILTSVDVQFFPDQHTFTVSIVFRVTENGANVTITLFQSSDGAAIIEGT